jgi:capsid protein
VYRFVIGNAIAAGQLPETEDWEEHSWQRPARPSLDPQRETMAAVLKIEHNLCSLADVHAEAGLDTETVLAQRKHEVDQQREMGILPTGTPAMGAAGGAGTDQSGIGLDQANADLAAADAMDAADKADAADAADVGGANNGA